MDWFEMPVTGGDEGATRLATALGVSWHVERSTTDGLRTLDRRKTVRARGGLTSESRFAASARVFAPAHSLVTSAPWCGMLFGREEGASCCRTRSVRPPGPLELARTPAGFMQRVKPRFLQRHGGGGITHGLRPRARARPHTTVDSLGCSYPLWMASASHARG